MSLSAVSAALQDALEKGDVVELEQAIVAAEDATHVSAHSRKASSSLGNLIARAKDMYRVHMEACRPYVKPLRKACKELSERGIFEALVRARGAPDEVQLCMYTDLCNAESLRHEIVEAQKIAVQLFDSTSFTEVDDFLSECSPFLEDRTLLALVQKREDLLREEKRRQDGRMTPLRSTVAGDSARRSRRDPLEEWGRYNVEDEGASPVNVAGRRATLLRTTSTGLSGAAPNNYSASGAVAAKASVSSGNVSPRSSTSVPAAYPAVRYTMERARDSGLQRAVDGGSSPWMVAMRSLRQQAYEEVVREESHGRRQTEAAEEEQRAQLYRAEMLEQVQCWATSALRVDVEADKYDDDDGENNKEDKNDEEVEREEEEATRRMDPVQSSSRPVPSAVALAEVARMRLPVGSAFTLTSAPLTTTPAATPSAPAAAAATSQRSATPTRVYAHTLPSYPLGTALATTPRTSNSSADAVPPPATGAILGGALRTQLSTAHRGTPLPPSHAAAAAAQNSPRLSRDTPNISPIKEMSATSGIASMWGEHDGAASGYRRGDTKPGWAEETEHGSPSPRRRDSVGSAGTATSTASSMAAAAAAPSLELRRIQARLRAVLQEEDIHRRDIEGTEDFDRSVFLFPVSARIAMLRRTTAQRLRPF